MPLGTLDRTPPPFFRQGPSALSKLTVFSAVAVLLMVADLRFRIAVPVRTTVATALYPLQWAVIQPVLGIGEVGNYFRDLHEAQKSEGAALKRLATQAARSLQLEQLTQENARLRDLLSMRERITTPATGAQVLYDTADPFSRKIVIDRGLTHGIQPGSPVIDESGVLGQVTRVYPMVSEVTLLIDNNQAIPVLNARTGVRSVVYGQSRATGDGLELRYTLSNADIQAGDLLTTSGVDGVYPPGLPVASVSAVKARAEASFTSIPCDPAARMQGVLHVMVLEPVGPRLPQLPPEATVGQQHKRQPLQNDEPARLSGRVAP